MSYVKVAEISEIPKGAKKKVVVGSIEILLCNIDGEVYAIDDKCPHMGGSLSKGNLDGHIITCPKHGSKFNVKTGKNEDGAKLLIMKVKVQDTKTRSVKIDGNDVFVSIKEFDNKRSEEE